MNCASRKLRGGQPDVQGRSRFADDLLWLGSGRKRYLPNGVADWIFTG